MKSSTRPSIIKNVFVMIFVVFCIYIIFGILQKGIEEIKAYNYPAHLQEDIFYDKFEIAQIIETQDHPEKVIRNDIIKKFISQGFEGRKQKPYSNQTGSILPGETRQDIEVANIENIDSLDVVIASYLDSRKTSKESKKPPLLFYREDLRAFKDVDLFRTKEDIDRLSYQVVSHRSRQTYDPAYRRYNIATALKKIGKVRVINPAEEIAYMDAIEYDGVEQKTYKSGFTVVLDEEQEEYGGGLCGASTAVYQGILTNSGLEVTEQRNHSKRFTNLYQADINGERIYTAGLDSTVYNGQIDLKIKNIRKYPIILVTDFDGEYGSNETVLTLGSSLDIGSYIYSHSYPIKSQLRVDKNIIPITGSCYHREVNGEDRQSCYKVVDVVKKR